VCVRVVAGGIPYVQIELQEAEKKELMDKKKDSSSAGSDGKAKETSAEGDEAKENGISNKEK